MSTAYQAGRVMRDMGGGTNSGLSAAVFFILILISAGVAWLAQSAFPPGGGFIFIPELIVSLLIASAIKVANQWDRGLVLRLGRFVGIRGPGLFFVAPILERVHFVDLRVQTHDIRRQEVITRDNVPVAINGVLFFKVKTVEDAVMKVQDYLFAVGQLAQTALRDVVGGMTLDETLSEREPLKR